MGTVAQPTAARPAVAELPGPAADRLAQARALVELGKPRLSALVVLTAWGGMMLAPGGLGAGRSLLALALIALAVGGANTLNCWFERDSDGLMKRTRGRPLPAGRVEPRAALAWGVAASASAVAALTLVVNPLTGLLAAIAVVSYAAVYTPLKRRTPLAVYVGAVPGAIPPLMGWTADTGRVELPGLALFAVLFAWQLPHFLAIALYLKEDYARAGIRAVPVVRGDERARRDIARWAVALVPVSLALGPLGVAGPLYLALAGALGVAFAAKAMSRPEEGQGTRWARSVMLWSVAYLALLMIAVAVDAA